MKKNYKFCIDFFNDVLWFLGKPNLKKSCDLGHKEPGVAITFYTNSSRG